MLGLSDVAYERECDGCVDKSGLQLGPQAPTPPPQVSMSTSTGTPTWFATGVQMSTSVASVSMETMIA
jgi:hypothetical protein